MSSAVVRSIDALRKSSALGWSLKATPWAAPGVGGRARLRSVIIVAGTFQLTVEVQIGRASQSAGLCNGVIGYLPPPPEFANSAV